MARKPLSEEAKARRREYMRNYGGRGGALPPGAVVGSAGSEPPFDVKTADALYVPKRDGPVYHADLTASLMGDPPVGRRALDKNPK